METTSLPAIRVRAHAKINLNLRVLERRDDGYHELSTVFQTLSLHDTLTFLPRPGPFTIESSDAALPVDRTNLIWRAADLLWSALGRHGQAMRDVSVHIDKRIPIKAGLGGGSADAAAALIGLARLWDAQMAAGDLMALGGQVGADVPFFFTGGAAMGLGRGDQIYPLADLPPLGALLVLPAFDVSTADAYRWIDELRQVGRAPAPPARASRVIPGCTWAPPACETGNDFEPVVAARHPEIARIVAMLTDGGAQAAALTGSGSAVFGLFSDGERLSQAAGALNDAGYRTEKTRTLSRGEYLQSSAPRGDLGSAEGGNS